MICLSENHLGAAIQKKYGMYMLLVTMCTFHLAKKKMISEIEKCEIAFKIFRMENDISVLNDGISFSENDKLFIIGAIVGVMVSNHPLYRFKFFHGYSVYTVANG